MKLTIYSLKGVEFEGVVSGFNVKTENGEITILNNHRPLITILKKGRAFILYNDNKREEIGLSGGFLEMTKGNELNVLTPHLQKYS